MRSRLFLGTVLAVLAASPSAAMDVQTFLAKAESLQAKGPLALFSSDYKLLKSEAEAAGAQLKAERLALAKAGKPAPYCPPEKGSLTSTELLGAMHAVPAADRSRTSVKDVMRGMLARKYPCAK